MKKHAISILVAVTMAAILLGACLTSGCSAAANQRAMRVLSMTVEECAKVALAQGRRDIAAYCGITDSALDILTASLADQTCTLPTDGGADAAPTRP